MGLVIIPFDYEQLPESQRKLIVPICIAPLDRHGNPIARVWFEQGVVPVQNQLRSLARYKLGDVRLVSELTEITVHKLWETHGDDAGNWPSRRVWVRAMWEARDLAAGNRSGSSGIRFRWRLAHWNKTFTETVSPTQHPTTRFMNENYWSSWSSEGSKRTIETKSVRFSRCYGRGTRGTKSQRNSMTRSRRR